MESGEIAVIRELAYEANTKYINGAYKSGFVRSLLTLIRIFVKSLFGRRSGIRDEPWVRPGATLAFSAFKNERNAIEEYVRERGVTLQHIQLDLRRSTGLDFYAVLGAGMLRFPAFLFQLIRKYGFGALRRFAYPFLGFALFCYLRKKFASAGSRGTVITTNMVHPVSLAVHYAARAAGWQTIYLEHAMTPRLIVKNRDYTMMLLRSLHTRQMLADAGINPETLEVLDYWMPHARPAPFRATAIHRLGIAINDLDDFAEIEFLAAVSSKNSISCELRVHDADVRLPAFRALGVRLGAEVSSAAKSEIMDFIRRQDVVVVGNSSVLLDCLRARVPAIYYWPGPAEIYDYYGLVEYMHYPAARNREELLRLLNL